MRSSWRGLPGGSNVKPPPAANLRTKILIYIYIYIEREIQIDI